MSVKRKGPGAPRKGRQVRERYSVRLEPSVVDAAVTKYGTLSAAIETGLSLALGRQKPAP